MSSTLRILISQGKISSICLRRHDHCHEQISDRNYELARRILESVEFQQIQSNQNYNYEVDLLMLAKYSFCNFCERAYPKQVESYHQVLMRCLAEEMEAQADPGSESGYNSGSDGPETEQQRCKERRSCHPNELESLAKQIKTLERQTDGLQRKISDLKQELEDERKQHEELKHNNAQMIDFAEAKYAEMFQIGETQFAGLMQKIAGLESQNLWLQQQMQNQHTIDHLDIAKMVGTIKELNASLVQCYGERYRLWLTPTSQHVVNTLEPM